MTIFIPLLLAIIGLLVYAFATNGKLAEVGRITFAAGIFVTLLRIGEAAISFLK